MRLALRSFRAKRGTSHARGVTQGYMSWLGGLDYAAVGRSIHRIQKRAEADKKLKRTFEMLNVLDTTLYFLHSEGA